MSVIKRTAQTEDDLIEIWTYIAAEDPQAADRMLDSFEEKFVLLAEQPQMGPSRQDIAPELRYFPVSNYLILYREIPDGIEIVRVIHGARRLIHLL